jgi:uroporphyrinogen-III synthase
VACDIARDLQQSGYKVKEIICYRQLPILLAKGTVNDILNGLIGAAVFFSPRSAKYFSDMVDFLPDNFVVFCISHEVSKVIKKEFPKSKLKYKVAEAPNLSDMYKLVVAAYQVDV